MMGNGVPLGIQDVSPHLSLLASEVLYEVSFRELLVTSISSLVLKKALNAIGQNAGTQEALSRLVEGDLTQVGPGVGVRSDEHVCIRIDKNSHRQPSLIQEDLRRRFMLAVEETYFGLAILTSVDPGERYLKLRALSMEFFDKTTYRISNRAWINLIVMM
jgi:hypothetical protein